MPKCKNDSKKSYKGTEPSPKGFGYCAHPEKVDKVKKGKDGNKWIIKKNIKGIKRWVKIKNYNIKDNKSLIKTIDIFKTKIKGELKKIGVKLYITKIKPINGRYIINYAWNDIDSDDKNIIVVIKLNNEEKCNELNLQHSGITYNTKKEVIVIFKKYFGKRFVWDGKQTHTINIKL